MSVVTELLRTEDNNTLSFGNYELAQKAKLDNYEFKGDLYKVKTCQEITKLEKNGKFLYESVPGTAVHELDEKENGLSFAVEGAEDSQITLELEDNTEYEVIIDDENTGVMKTNMSGKLTVSTELEAGQTVQVSIIKK